MALEMDVAHEEYAQHSFLAVIVFPAGVGHSDKGQPQVFWMEAVEDSI